MRRHTGLYVTILVFACILFLTVVLWSKTEEGEGEGFTDIASLFAPADGSQPSPSDLFKQVRSLLDKYDRPEVWNHAAQVMDKDPGELARMYQKQQHQ